MPLRPKTEIPTERIQLTVPTHVHELVKAYAKFLGHDTDPAYIYGEAALKVIRGDRAFESADTKPEGRRGSASQG
jgi:hypothetical protein